MTLLQREKERLCTFWNFKDG